MVRVAEIVLSFQTLLSTFSEAFVKEGTTLERIATDPCIQEAISPEGKFTEVVSSHLLQSVIKKHVTQSFVRLDTLPTPLISPTFLTASKHLRPSDGKQKVSEGGCLSTIGTES
jgi:hypothetical protein